MTKVVNLNARRAEDDNSVWTPEEMLRETLSENLEGRDAGIVVLHSKGDDYSFGWRLCNLRYSEAIALLEAVKFEMLAQMTGRDE